LKSTDMCLLSLVNGKHFRKKVYKMLDTHENSPYIYVN